MIVWLSEKITDALVCSGTVKQDDRDVYIYGLDVLLSTAANFACIFAIGILIGRAPETLLFMAAFTVLRSAAGGYHADTHFVCFLITCAAFAFSMALVSVLPADACRWASLPVAAVSLAAVLFLAPAPHPNRPVSAVEYTKFKKLSLWIAILEAAAVAILAVSNVPVLAFSMALGMFASGASLGAACLAGLHGKRGPDQ